MTDLSDGGYTLAPKDRPTPLFDEWKRCPRCKSTNTQLCCHFQQEIRIATKPMQTLTVYFKCSACSVESERRTMDLDTVPVVEN